MSDANTIETLEHQGPKKPGAAALRPVVVVAFPDHQAVEIPTGPLEIGRRFLRSIGIEDGEISGKHAVLKRRGARITIRDSGSRNGTWVNGRRLVSDEDRELDDGDCLRLGRTLLVVRKSFQGPLEPDPPLGRFVAPWGLRDVKPFVEALVQSNAHNILVEGETGAGKELLAEALASAFGRRDRYAAVNVASLPRGVFEAQLFGHVAGAFSDARTAAPGVIRAHDGGVVFLDEIGELPSDMQPKLLRLLENREIVPVGASGPVGVDVVLVAATNQDLDALLEEGAFRRDLLARFLAARLCVPALRERREDIFAVARALAVADPTRAEHGLAPESVEVEAMERLLLEAWPDNARGLDAVLRRAKALDPQPGLRAWAVERVLGPRPVEQDGELSAERVARMLEACGGSEREAARRLGVSRGKLRRFLGK